MARRNGRYTVADHATWPEDERWELIGGEAHMMTPAPSGRHQQISVRLTSRLDVALENAPCVLYHAPTDLLFEATEETDTVVEPDLFVICGPHKSNGQVIGIPVLVIEILSPSTARRDKVVKRALYERVGVKEYWLVDPSNEIVDIMVHDGARFGPLQSYGQGDIIESTMLPGIAIEVKSVFAQKKLESDVDS